MLPSPGVAKTVCYGPFRAPIVIRPIRADDKALLVRGAPSCSRRSRGARPRGRDTCFTASVLGENAAILSLIHELGARPSLKGSARVVKLRVDIRHRAMPDGLATSFGRPRDDT